MPNQGGGGGGGGPKKTPPKKGGGNKPRGNNRGGGNSFIRQANRMQANLDRPYLRQLAQQESKAEDLTEELSAQSRNIYGALVPELREATGYYREQAPGIAEGLNERVGALASLIGTQSPESELGAAGGALGAVGAGGQTLLAGNESRNLGYGTSTQRQAAIEKGVVQQNYLEQLADALSEIQTERKGVVRDRASSAKDLAFQLRQQQFDRSMALKDFALRKAAAEAQIGNDAALIQLSRQRINSLLNDNRRNDRGRDNRPDNRPNKPPPHPGRQI